MPTPQEQAIIDRISRRRQERRVTSSPVAPAAPPPAAPVPAVEESGGGGFMGFLNAGADAFRSVVPQGVRDVAGTGVQTVLSGERAANLLLPGDPGTAVRERIEDIPVVGGFAAEAADTLTSPLTLATLGFGGPLSASLKAGQLGVAGRLAAPLVAPVISGGIGARTAGEVGVAVGSAAAGNIAEAVGADPLVGSIARLGGGLAGARQARALTTGVPNLTIAPDVQGAIREAAESGDPVRRFTVALQHATDLQPERRAAISARNTRLASAMERLKGQVDNPDEYLRRSRKMAEGIVPGPAFELPEGLRFDAGDIASMKQNIFEFPGFEGRGFELNRTLEAFNKVVTRQLPEPNEIKLLERVFGPEFGGAIDSLKNPSTSAALWDLLGVPRAVMASWDMSAPFRQAAPLVGRRQFWGNLFPMTRAWMSEDFVRAAHEDIWTRPSIRRAVQSDIGLHLSAVTKLADLGRREEGFMSRFAERFIPGVRRSERAFVTFLNKLRADVYESTIKRWDEAGRTYGDDDLRSLAEWVNTATGRGNIPPNTLVAHLGQVLFAPRLLVRNAEILSGRAYARATPLVRQEVGRDLASFAAAGLGTLGLLKLASEAGVFDFPVSVEMNPRSSDFAKARIGSTRFDAWGGFQPIVRYLAQFASGERKASSGDLREADRAITLGRFAQSKLAPVPGFLIDVLRGENFIGEEVDVTTSGGLSEQAAQRLVPLFVQDLVEAWQVEGMVGSVKTLPAFVGFNVQTYESTAQVRQAGAREMFDKDWQELTGQERAQVTSAYADRLARQQAPKEGSIAAFVDNEALQLRAFEQDANNAVQQGLVDRRTFTANMLDRNAERINRISGVMDREGFESSGAQALLSDYFALRDQATVAGQTDYELLDQIQADFLRALTPAERRIIEERSTFQHAPEVQWWVDDRQYITGSGYWRVQRDVMDSVRGLIDRLAPGVTTYNQLLAASRDPNLQPAQRARLEAVAKRIDQLTRRQRDLLRARDPRLDEALVSVYGMSPIRSR